jgi:CHAP domain
MRASAPGRVARCTCLSLVAVVSMVLMLAQPATAQAQGSVRAPGTALQPGEGVAATTGLFKDGGVLRYGAAQFFGSPTQVHLAAPVVAMAATPDGAGYWLVGADGGVLSFGDARYFGSAGARGLQAPIVAMAATPDGAGYWLVGADGSVFTFGDAHYYGAPVHVPEPVVSFAATPDGQGYWLAGSHGEVYAFGDARYYGSLGATNLHNLPVVAIAPSHDGLGYWLVQGGGEVVPYGDAPRLGGMRGHPPVAGIAVSADGLGYWLVCDNGEVDAFGDAQNFGGNDLAVPRPPISAIVADPAGPGYWLLDPEAFPVSLDHPGPGAHGDIVKIAVSQLGPSRGGGDYCNPYGPCEEWCALFATWVWEDAGIAIPRYSFVGSVYYWAKRHTRVIAVSAKPVAGDLVLYGTGPQNGGTSPHIGIVAQVWPDGEIDTVEGDAGPGPDGWTSVLVNGPYLPSQSYFANGMPIYGFAVP